MDTKEFRNALLRGGVNLPSLPEARTLTKVDDPGLVPTDAAFVIKLYDRLTDYSAAMAAGITITETPEGNPWPVVVTVDQPRSRRVPEGATVRETSNITFARFYLGAHKYTGQVAISNELLEDSYLEDFVDELADKLAEAIARQLDPLFIRGTGVDQPRGLVGNVEAGAAAGNNTNPDLFLDLSTSLDPALLRRKDQLRWLMSVEAYREVAEFAGTGAGDAAEASRATSDDDPLYLWGYPVVLTEHMALGTARGSTLALFGHFGRAYQARAVPMRSDISGHAEFPMDVSLLRGVSRVDGRVRDRTAVKALVRGPLAVIDSFTAGGATTAGGTVTLTWATTGATSVLVNGAVQSAVDGSTTVTIPANAEAGSVITYDIEARSSANSSLTTYDTVEVTVTA